MTAEAGGGRAIARGYRLGPEVAHGAMGSMHSAVDSGGRPVANKRLLDDGQSAPSRLKGRWIPPRSDVHGPGATMWRLVTWSDAALGPVETTCL